LVGGWAEILEQSPRGFLRVTADYARAADGDHASGAGAADRSAARLRGSGKWSIWPGRRLLCTLASPANGHGLPPPGALLGRSVAGHSVVALTGLRSTGERWRSLARAQIAGIEKPGQCRAFGFGCAPWSWPRCQVGYIGCASVGVMGAKLLPLRNLKGSTAARARHLPGNKKAPVRGLGLDRWSASRGHWPG
jgi:hypothetical protein